MKFQTAILFGKLTGWIISLFRLGSGATWPGEIALRIYPQIVHEFAAKAHTIILIAGTNGKTTTAKMAETILKKGAGKKVTRNASGANLDNGIISTFLQHTHLFGKLKKDTFIFEIDEASLPKILSSLKPDCIVLLNLFRDQLDRYGEVDLIAEKWIDCLKRYVDTEQYRGNHLVSPTVIINGDDPYLTFIGSALQQKNKPHTHQIFKKVQVNYFGLHDPELYLSSMDHATDSLFCPQCGNRLTFGGVYFSHLGTYACGKCGFTHPKLTLTAKDVKTPLEGVYNVYNTLAATLIGLFLGISDEDIASALSTFKPAFGRMERLVYKDKAIQIILSKNPTGFNESLRAVLSSKNKGPLVILLNDRIPDGRDISWIYDVDFEMLEASNQMIFLSGDRALDLGTRLHYTDIKTERVFVFTEFISAIERAVQQCKEEEQVFILATYSAMLEARQVIIGRKIL